MEPVDVLVEDGRIAAIRLFDQALYEGPGSQALGEADIAYLVGFVVAGALYWFLERSNATAVALKPAAM